MDLDIQPPANGEEASTNRNIPRSSLQQPRPTQDSERETTQNASNSPQWIQPKESASTNIAAGWPKSSTNESTRMLKHRSELTMEEAAKMFNQFRKKA